MSAQWLSRFLTFAKAIDYVNDDIFENVQELLEDYFRKTLEVCFFRLSCDGFSIRSNGADVPALSPIWSSHRNRLGDIEILTDGGECNGLEAYCYHRRRALWINGSEGQPLQNATELADSWSHATDLPAFSDYCEGKSMTCVVYPLEYGGRLFGVLRIDFAERLPISGRARRATSALANGLSRLVWLRDTSNAQLADSREAFSELVSNFPSASSPLIPRSVFLATSKSADDTVVRMIKEVLGEFDHLFEVDHWIEENASGSVNEHVRAAITAAEFGVCYLSEPKSVSGETQVRFQDNPNVLFEAGMFQMLHEMRDARNDPDASRWIPVREAAEISTPIPFDIAGERIVFVSRGVPQNDVDEENFALRMRGAIAELVRSLRID